MLRRETSGDDTLGLQCIARVRVGAMGVVGAPLAPISPPLTDAGEQRRDFVRIA